MADRNEFTKSTKVGLMISSIEIGRRLNELRRARSLTQAHLAQQMAMSRATWVSVEQGNRPLSPVELVRVADLLSVSVHELVGEHYVSGAASPRFRISPGTGVETSQAQEAVETLSRRGRWYAELEQICGVIRMRGPLETLVTYQLTGEGEVGDPRITGQAAAQTARRMLALGDGPALGLDDLFEQQAGLRIFYFKLPSVIAGMLLWGPEIGACIGINRDHPLERRRWTLVHELGHFLRDREAGDVLPTADPPRRGASELFADAFAAEFLMPASGMVRFFTDRIRGNDNRFTPADLLEMAAFFQVSFQAVTLRLEDLRLLPPGVYERLVKNRFKVSEHRRQLGFDSLQRGTAPAWPRRYLGLAFRAYERELISEGDLAQYLEIDRVEARSQYQEYRLSSADDGDVALDLAMDILFPDRRAAGGQ